MELGFTVPSKVEDSDLPFRGRTESPVHANDMKIELNRFVYKIRGLVKLPFIYFLACMMLKGQKSREHTMF